MYILFIVFSSRRGKSLGVPEVTVYFVETERSVTAEHKNSPSVSVRLCWRNNTKILIIYINWCEYLITKCIFVFYRVNEISRLLRLQATVYIFETERSVTAEHKGAFTHTRRGELRPTCSTILEAS